MTDDNDSEGLSAQEAATTGMRSKDVVRPSPNDTMAGTAVVEAAIGATPTQRKTPDIFVSYRVQPDEPLAQALKQLLQSAFDPTPNIFVSGLGGVRASHESFRQQLQGAAGQAKAFFGVITPHSKEREWIFFEAGAAFGREVPYVPILFGVDFSELSNTIAGNHALLHDDRDGIQRALGDLSSLVDCQVRSHFGQRYGRFLRSVKTYRSDQVLSPTDEGDELSKALELLRAGDLELAGKAFDELINSTKDREEKCRAIITRHVFWPEPNGSLAALLEEMTPDLKETLTWAYWTSSEETRPVTKQSMLERVVKASPGALPNVWETMALQERLRCKHDKLIVIDAERRLLRLLESPSMTVRANAGYALLTAHPSLSEIAKLICISTALQQGRSDIFAVAADLAAQLGWKHVDLYLASRAAAEGDGTSLNRFGIRLEANNLPSLAYEHYRRASDTGVSVATVNMASLLLRAANYSAALSLIKKENVFNASDPGYPYELRAQLERGLTKEENTFGQLVEHGRGVTRALATIAEIGLYTSIERVAGQEGQNNFSAETSSSSPQSIVLAGSPLPNSLSLERVSPFKNVFATAKGDEHPHLAAKSTDGWRVVELFPANEGPPSWFKIAEAERECFNESGDKDPDSDSDADQPGRRLSESGH